MGKLDAFQKARDFEEYGKYLEKKMKRHGRKMDWKKYNEDMENEVDKICYFATKERKSRESEMIHNSSKEIGRRFAHDNKITRSYIIK